MSQALGLFPILVLASLALVVGALISVGLSSHFRNLEEERLHETTQLARGTIVQALRDRLRVLADHARLPLVVQGVTQPEANADLVDLMGTLKVLGSKPRLKLLDFEGNTIHATKPGLTYYAREDWVAELISGQRGNHVDLGRSALGSHWLLAVPVLYNGASEGILVAEVPVAAPLESLRSGPLSGARIMISRDGEVYASLGSKLDGSIAEHISRGPVFDVRCQIDRSATEVARVRIVLGITVAFIVVAIVITLLSIWIGSRVLGKPLEQLRRSVARVSSSNGENANATDELEAYQHVDEIRALATSFREMEQAIRQREAELRKARDQLEDRVEERTVDLELATQRADSANRAKSVFLAKMSYEIRTPLQSILGVSQILDGTELDESQRHCVDVLLRSGTSLLELLDEVLDFSRIETNELNLVNTTFCIREVVDGVVDTLRVLVKEKGLRLSVTIDDAVPPAVEGDPIRLRQVLLNLLSNAVKFTDEGEVSITVEAVDAEVLLFTVRDTGVGIPEEVVELIFDPFFQGDTSTTRHGGGSGLGLAVAREIVARLGGKLEVESCPEVGSTFAFTARFTPVDVATSRQRHHADEERSECFSGLRILLAEDDRTNRFVTRKVLERLGCEVTATKNGSELIDAWEQGDHDVILVDCHLPLIDGYQATREIRKRESANVERGRVPIVALTANALPEDRERCLEAGMDDFVAKPFGSDDIRDVLERCAPTKSSARSST